MFFPRRPGEAKTRFLAGLLASLDDRPEEEMEAGLKSADELDLVELVMEVEEALRPGHG
jgi:hypothetical protein